MATPQQATDAAIAMIGRRPVWVNRPPVFYATQPPASSSQMVSTEADRLSGGALVCALRVQLREDPSRRTARTEIEAFDAGTTYTVTIDGEAFDQVGTTDAETTQGLLADAITVGITFTGTRTIKGQSSVQVGTYDAATTYSIAVEGVAFTSLAAGSRALAVAALAAAITARFAGRVEAAVNTDEIPGLAVDNAVVLTNLTGQPYDLAASASGGTGTITSRDVPAVAEYDDEAEALVITGTSWLDYTVEVSQAGAAGWHSLKADATSVTFQLWGIWRDQTVPEVLSWEERVVTVGGGERLTVSGISHLELQVLETDGRVAWGIGPCDLEST